VSCLLMWCVCVCVVCCDMLCVFSGFAPVATMMRKNIMINVHLISKKLRKNMLFGDSD